MNTVQRKKCKDSSTNLKLSNLLRDQKSSFTQIKRSLMLEILDFLVVEENPLKLTIES